MDEERLDNWMRGVEASMMAYEFLLRYLITATITPFPPEQKVALIEHLRTLSRQTKAFEGLAKGDEMRAERLSDVGIRAQGEIDRLLDLVKKGSGSRS